MKLIIPGTLPSLNEIIDAAKRNPHEYSKMKRAFTAYISQLAKKQLGNVSVEHADFEFRWYCPNKRKDKDNVIAGQKFVLDSLQHAGIIGNDGWKQIGDLNHKLEVDKQNPRVEVIIHAS